MAGYNPKNRDTEYTRVYDSLGGMDSQGFSQPDERYATVRNMYIDYEGGTPCLESIPGYRLIKRFSERINGIFRQCSASGEEFIIVHAGKTLYSARLSDLNKSDAFSSMADISDAKSTAFSFRDRLFLLDGSSIYVIEDATRVISLYSAETYIPTTYLNGKRLERRNMLSSISLERYTVSSADEYLYGTPGLCYAVLDSKEKTCYVSGFSGEAIGDIYIPRFADIGGIRYEVVEIGDYALRFYNRLTSLHTSRGLRRVGKSALRGCTALSSVQLSSSVGEIDEYAFYGCTRLAEIYLGESLTTIGGAAFGQCTQLSTVNYERDLTSFNAIAGVGALPDGVSLVTFSEYTATKLCFQLYGSIEGIGYINLNGNNYAYTYDSVRNTVSLSFEHPDECEGGDFEIFVRNASSRDDDEFSSPAHYNGFAPSEAVLGCTVGAVFDGKIFLSGNPSLPGAVFYSGYDLAKNPDYTYFRECDFFVDGEGGEGVCSMLPLTDTMLVFRSGNNSSGAIFYHKRSSDAYPLCYVHHDLSILSKSYTLYDDALFLSYDGISTVTKSLFGDYKTVSRCSGGILGGVDIEKNTPFDFVLFKGYATVLLGDKIYLGDIRRSYKIGNEESFEWYELSGVGDYKDDRGVYRYSAAYGGLDEAEGKTGLRAEGTVISKKTEDGASVYYVETEGKKYAVLPTDEREGGSFYPAKALFTLDGLLFFGTDSGALCVFNTDKVGEAPEYLSKSEGFDAEEYKKQFGKVLHPHFYSFMGHAPICCIETLPDSLDTTSLTKSTSKGSVSLTLKAEGEGMPSLFVSTDGKDFQSVPLAERRYGNARRFKLMADEREKGYIDKRYKISCAEYNSPFGVYSLEYRYKIKGRIKK